MYKNDFYLSYDIIVKQTTFYDDQKSFVPKGVILHCVGLDFLEALRRLSGEHPVYRVSIHYFIPQYTGRELQEKFPQIFSQTVFKYLDSVPVIALVPETKIAYHAGMSTWMAIQQNGSVKPLSGLNEHTIGIEFHSPHYASQFLDENKTQENFFYFGDFHPSQIQTGIKLIHDILKRNQLPSKAVLGHSDIAAYRSESQGKTDPGPYFPWQNLAKQGIGVYPDIKDILSFSFKDFSERMEFCRKSLERIGYCHVAEKNLENLKANLIAFIMHFMSSAWEQDLEKKPLESLLTDEVLSVMENIPCLYWKE